MASCWGLEALREMDERGLVDGSEMRVICSGSVAGSPEGIAGCTSRLPHPRLSITPVPSARMVHRP